MTDGLETTLRVHIWFETGDGMLFGTGRAQLLENIDRFGSLNKASKAMGMSYRAAWGRLKQTEEVLGEPLVVKHGGRKGYSLTDLGKKLLADYKRWFKQVEDFAVDSARQQFPWTVKEFDEPGAD